MRAHLVLLLLLACAKAAPPKQCAATPSAAGLERAGIRAGGSALLPGGRGVEPMGEILQVGQNPLHLALSPDGALISTAEFGVNLRGLSVASSALQLLKQPVQSRSGGYLRGLAFSSDGQTLWAVNTGAKRIEAWDVPAFAQRRDIAVQGDWPADLAVDGSRIYVTLALSNKVQTYDANSGALLREASTGHSFPHAMLLDGNRLFVANEGADPGRRNRLMVFDSQTLAQSASYEVGKNPAALALSPDKRILYVAASDDDWIDRIDLENGALLQPIQLAQPGAGGSYSGLSISPNALAVDGARLYVSAAMLNAILVIDTATGAQIGAIPAGVRPSDVAVSQGALYILNSKGAGTLPDEPGQDNSDAQRGTLQRISPIPGDLTGPTAAVARLNALPRHEYEPPDQDCATIGPLPATRSGDPSLSKIKHVVMVLKENKTFDGVFGDFPGAEADRTFLEWGAKITPNQHELAHQFCLLDNFYNESEQSLEGHFWATAQVTTDYFERIWHAAWGGHVIGPPLFPPAGVSPLDSPRGGFIFDALARAGIPYTSYGEFVGTSGDLAPHIDTHFVDLPFNFLARPDTEKLPLFLAAISAGKLQPFTFIALQYDHTFGLSPGMPSPDYMIADNDLATGQLVEAISHSKYWDDTLILITEDDPSGAADHVDSHRSFALVVSPWARRGRVSHVRASVPSLAATYERALGIQPVSALDAQAEPLWDCLTGTPDKTPFTALPSNVARTVNPARPGLRALDFSAVDRARGLGIQLWQSSRPGEPVPVQILRSEGDDDAD